MSTHHEQGNLLALLAADRAGDPHLRALSKLMAASQRGEAQNFSRIGGRAGSVNRCSVFVGFRCRSLNWEIAAAAIGPGTFRPGGPYGEWSTDNI